MYRKILVENEIGSGERLLEQLDLAKVPITAAFWHYSDEANEWRLMIVTPFVETQGRRQLYTLIDVMLSNPSGAPIPIRLERIYLLGPHDIRYQELRSAALGGGSGLLPTGGTIRNISAEDAYIYRVG